MPTITVQPASIVEVTADSAVAWTGPGNAVASDDSDATAGVSSAAQVSNRLRAIIASAGVPLLAQIDSIAFTVEVASESGTKTVKDSAAQLWDGSALVGTDQATAIDFPATDTDRTYTFAGSNLGSIGPTELNSGAFGVSWRMRYNGGLGTVTGRMDSFKNITIVWSLPASIGSRVQKTARTVRTTRT